MTNQLAYLAVGACLTFAVNAAASSSFDSVVCSGSQTESLVEGTSLFCSGDFSLVGGAIISESKVAITADGGLSLANLSINAPVIELTSLGGLLSVGNNVFLTGQSIFLTAGTSLTIDASSTINVSGDGQGDPGIRPPAGGTITVGGREIGRIIGTGGGLRPIDLGEIEIQPGGDISLFTPAIPEPSTYLTMLFGLMGVAGMVKFRASKRRSS